MEKNELVLQLKEVVIDNRARAWCKLPYPNHPKGCPNHGKREGCPPQTPLFEDFVKPPFTLVAVRFNLEKHVKRMKEKHPKWSNRQARCILYWQKGLDKKLNELSEKVSSKNSDLVIVYKPEAYGVHLFETCRKHGLVLEKNPQNTVWKMTIIGKKK